ncbi:MAG: hypothetical protein NTY53_03535 [Kiritimatiellaeota bacterium]|nr:hypothetical protein [Kiritimatiellota bacterium]
MRTMLGRLFLGSVLLGATLTAAAQQSNRTIHVFVALCDNANQGIVPVPAELGNGADPAHNLYWGARYGVKTWFKQSPGWELRQCWTKPRDGVLERCLFQNQKLKLNLIADAYAGTHIRAAIGDFLKACAGAKQIKRDDPASQLTDAAELIAYVGHNGLMEFSLPLPDPAPVPGRDAVVLACSSKNYFPVLLQRTRSRAMLLTRGFMAPEAYTLDAAVTAWATGASAEVVRQQAAVAYDQHQKCGLANALRLFWSEDKP